MIGILSRIFIKDRHNYTDASVRSKYGFICGILGIILNFLLFCVKMLAGMLSNSVSVCADAFNNLGDAGSSIVTLFGFKAAEMKPDSDHPFGHGRYEYISGFTVSIIIILMGVEFVKSSVEKIASGVVDGGFSVITAVILVLSVLVKVYICIYNKSVGKKISSGALSASGTDALCDCIATTVILIGSVVSHFTSLSLDGWCGLAVSLFIIYSGINAARETVNPLLGTPPSKEFVHEVTDILMSHEEILGIHDLVVHDYAPGHIMISVHAEISDKSDLILAHELVDNVEQEISEKLGCEAVIHMDPISTDDELVNQTKTRVCEVLKAIHEDVTIHDFRMVEGNSHTNLIFDAVVPYEIKKENDVLKKEISELVKSIDEKYNAVVKIDRKMV